ncbi:hypothetical protein PTTG_09897, partial [Puccinia triticina 1-1 BBBD Race 1]
MSSSFIVRETRAGEPLSPYSLASEELTNPPESDTSSTKSESNSPAPETSEPPLILNSPNIVSSSFVPPPAPSMGKIEMLAVSAALRQMDASSYIDDHLDTLRSPSPETPPIIPAPGLLLCLSKSTHPNRDPPFTLKTRATRLSLQLSAPKTVGQSGKTSFASLPFKLRAAAFATSSVLTFLSWAAPSL